MYDKRIEFFHRLKAKRAGLAYELIKAFDDSEEEELNSSLILSFEHIERVLMFKCILQYEAADLEDFLFYLQTALNETSYYACMALPLVRQIIESPACSGTGSGTGGGELQGWREPKVNFIHLCQNEKDEKRVVFSCRLAARADELLERYLAIEDPDEMVLWSKHFSILCAFFIMFDSALGVENLFIY